MNHLNIVLKIAERCNLACSYCYFFFSGDESYKQHSPLLKKDTFDTLICFLENGIVDCDIKSIDLYFHGGEPLLIKKHIFEYMCQKVLTLPIRVRLFVQTNALLIDKEWIEIFQQYNVSIGVSIDGTKKFHDMYRIDKKGNGSYDKTVEKLKVLKLAFDEGKLKNFGTLTVVNKEYNAIDIYKHFRQVLDLKGFDFLLPDYTHDTFKDNPLEYGRFLCKLLDEWFQEKNPEVQIRFITSYLFQMMGKKLTTRSDILPQYNSSQTITVSSDGDLNVDDTLLGTCNSDFKTGYTIHKNTLKDFINHDIFKLLYEASTALPEDCLECKWKNICQGGQLIHRYSHENGFKNKSIMCEGLMLYYENMYSILIKQGYSINELNKNLFT